MFSSHSGTATVLLLLLGGIRPPAAIKWVPHILLLLLGVIMGWQRGRGSLFILTTPFWSVIHMMISDRMGIRHPFDHSEFTTPLGRPLYGGYGGPRRGLVRTPHSCHLHWVSKKRVWESVFRAALGDIQQLPLLKKLEGLFITLEFLFWFYEIGFLLVGKWGWFTCRTFLKGKSAIWRTGKLVVEKQCGD